LTFVQQGKAVCRSPPDVRVNLSSLAAQRHAHYSPTVRANGFDGNKTSRGALIVNLVLCGCAAYRTQLFLYLKACGREELGTMNLWAGVDARAAV
jgi:hypothetical protein